MALPTNYSTIINEAKGSPDAMRKALGLPPLNQNVTNPCSELHYDVNNMEFKIPASGGYILPGQIAFVGDGRLAEWRGYDPVRIEGGIIADRITNMRNKQFKQDYDENTLIVEVPGVTRDEIEVFTQESNEWGEQLFVRVREEQPIIQTLGSEETIKSVKLDLGILTVIIDKAKKRKLLEIE